MPDAMFTFPQGFLWGTATSSHQVEGGNTRNDWWAFEHLQDGGVYDNHVSGDAAGWWEGEAEGDIERMRELNTNTHRLSVEWSRIEPVAGRWNYEALDRYREILTAMRKAGIKPMVTLHHFTNPQWMADRGGWAHPESAEWFRRFAAKVVGDLADLTDLWCTINEPNIYAAQSYFAGLWPPRQQNITRYFQVVRNMVHAHAQAYTAIHDVQPGAQVGLAKHMIDWHPMNPSSPLDRLMSNLLDSFFNGITLEVLATGEWKPLIGRNETIGEAKNSLDWIGLNFYQRLDAFFDPSNLKGLGIGYQARPGAPTGPEAWGELSPPSLLPLIRRLFETLNVPLYITENGMPDEHDTNRPGHLLQSLYWVWKACMHNYPVRGYYFWSLVDNFEWAEGYDPRFRFGLYGVDFATQARTRRDSARLYAEVCAANGFNTQMARTYAPEVVDELFPGVGDQPST
ncbi:MAG: glycoside hydrolase family 1 protein [Chloroflexi bacterium]|nr:glycoside hydrolase family 1 protein [Chloroflexota bacterium]